MADTERYDFSNRTYSLAERFQAQEKASHSFIGRALIRAIAGSNSTSYEQADWFSQDVHAEVPKIVIARGDPAAGRFPRSWDLAFILGSPGRTVERMHDGARGHRTQDAVAFRTQDSLWHVGVHPAWHHLFREDEDGSATIAMRHGRRKAIVSMGLWLPDERVYLGSPDVELLEFGIPADQLHKRPTEPILL